MRRSAGALLALLLALLSFAGCSRISMAPLNVVQMGTSSFDQSTATVAHGLAVKFIDLGGAAGGTHILVNGQNGKLVANNQAPSELNGSGTQFSPGEEKDIIFPNPGTYTVTCTVHPAMLVTITVT